MILTRRTGRQVFLIIRERAGHVCWETRGKGYFAGERAPKIISPDVRKPEEDTKADGPEEKQFGNFGLPSFLPV